MKLFRVIKKIVDNQESLFYLFLFTMIIANIVLCFTETMPMVAKICNVLLPFSIYYWLMTRGRNCGITLWILFPFVFLGAFQIVLLYLFGQSIIAVDMFLNLVTTNSTEAMELLDNLIPAIVTVVVLYVPALILAMISIVRKQKVSNEFLFRERKRAWIALAIGGLSLGAAYIFDGKYELKNDLYPANVCYNIKLAFQRTAKTHNYAETSKEFTFNAKTVRKADKEVYVMVVGETARAENWSIYGYERETNPRLSKIEGVSTFCHVLTESNTTHKSVPMLLSSVSASDFDSIYYCKSIITAFKEAGYQTAFFSNQRYNRSFIDFFGMEANTCGFIKEEDKRDSNYNPLDDELLKQVANELAKDVPKHFIVLHTYGSHFNYRERYPLDSAVFLPDFPVDAKVEYKDNLINAYDNSIRYTDGFLARIISMLEEQNVDAAMIYTSDHGEDIFDDGRNLFLHASPVPSYYQMHVPFLVWMSQSYRQANPAIERVAKSNRQKNISSSASFFHTMLEIGGIETSYRNDSLSVTSALFTEKPRLYLNDRNEARSLNDIGMRKEDFKKMEEKGIR